MNFSPLTAFLDSLPAYGIPGCDCGIYYRHQPVYRHSAGYKDAEKKIPFSGDELYFLYSASKVITCAAALTLFENGRFLMTDPLSDYLPEFSHMQVKSRTPSGNEILTPAKNSIRVQDLFTMSAGFDYCLESPEIQQVKQATRGACPTREVVRAIASRPLQFEPGTHWNYSLCHDVLAGFCEVISGKRFSDFVKEAIFEPLGMKDSSFHPDEAARRRIAPLYLFDDAQGRANRLPTENQYVLGSDYDSGGAGVISSVEDYLKFADALCGRGASPGGRRILSPNTVELMRKNHLDEVRMKDFDWIQMAGYGYGLGVRTMVSPQRGGALSSIGEFGWGGAAGAYVLIDPDREIALFYAQHMCNNKEPFVHPRVRNLVYTCLDRE